MDSIRLTLFAGKAVGVLSNEKKKIRRRTKSNLPPIVSTKFDVEKSYILIPTSPFLLFISVVFSRNGQNQKEEEDIVK